jgi:hypothetical protein
MRSRELEEIMRPAVKTATRLWVLMLASVGSLVAAAHVAVGRAEGERTPMGEEVMLALLAGAAVCAVLSLVLPGKLLSDERIRERMQAESFDLAQYLKNPQTGEVDHARVAKVSRLPPLEQRLATLPGLYFTPWILGMAMAHSVAAVGLVLAMLMQDVQWVWPFGAVAIVLLALRRPRFDGLFERATRLARSPRAR